MQDSSRNQQQQQRQQQQEARQAMDILTEMSSILNTGLDRETLSVCVSLCESGANPEALAAVIKELRRESAALKVAEK
ncbi:Mitotic-spindle organizing protein 1 [Podila epigama]|nr:Mitotic-spindle organizing protein 1 [Podila epigama]